MTTPLDVQAVLEFAGADINAAPGSVQHSLALVALVAQQHAAMVAAMPPTEGQTTTEATDEPAGGCNYSGYEFGASYPDSYCVGGFLHDADSDYLNDESIPCPMCDREAAIQWWFGRWEGMSAVGDERPQEQIDADHLANATSLVDDIRFNRGIPLPTAGAKSP